MAFKTFDEASLADSAALLRRQGEAGGDSPSAPHGPGAHAYVHTPAFTVLSGELDVYMGALVTLMQVQRSVPLKQFLSPSFVSAQSKQLGISTQDSEEMANLPSLENWLRFRAEQVRCVCVRVRNRAVVVGKGGGTWTLGHAATRMVRLRAHPTSTAHSLIARRM